MGDGVVEHELDRAKLVERYLHGWCAHLACAIQRRTDWTMVGIHGPDEHGGPPRHVACRLPDGTFADARGIGLSAAAVCEGYVDAIEEFTMRPVSAGEMIARFHREEGAHEQASRDCDILLPELPPGEHQATFTMDVDGDRMEICADFDLGAVAEVLGGMSEIRGVRPNGTDILLTEVQAAAAQRDVLIGWIESVVLAAGEGAPMPLRSGVHPYPRLSAAVAHSPV